MTKFILTIIFAAALQAGPMTTVVDATTFHNALWSIGATCNAPCTPDPPEFDQVLAESFFGYWSPLLTLYVLPSQYGYELFLEPIGQPPPGYTGSGPTLPVGPQSNPPSNDTSDLPQNPPGPQNPQGPQQSNTQDNNNPPQNPPSDPSHGNQTQQLPATDQTAVPEPATWSVALGLIALAGARTLHRRSR